MEAIKPVQTLPTIQEGQFDLTCLKPDFCESKQQENHAPIQVRQSSKKVKVTPTQMKKYCLRPSNRPPQPRLHVGGNTSLMNNWNTHAWIAAHQKPHQSSVQDVIEGVQYISHQEFLKELSKSLKPVCRQIRNTYKDKSTLGTHCIALVQEGKSNLWVAELAKEHFGFDAERYMDLGLNNAEKFSLMLAGISKKNLHLVREKFKGKTIILFDDASYSGKQMSSHLMHVRSSVYKYKLQVKQIAVVVPFATPYAMQKIKEASKRRPGDAVKVLVGPAKDLLMLSNLPQGSYRQVIDLWYQGKREDANKIGLAYFQHKVPNDQSFPAPLINGSIYHMNNGQSQSQKNSYKFIPEIIPSYKGTVAARFKTPGGDSNK